MGKVAVEIRVLGTFEVTIDGRDVAELWPSRRSAELVQLLAISPGRRLVRDQAIDALWPHLTADAGGANLRKAAHHARRALGHDGAVVLRHHDVVLFPEAQVTVDLERFTIDAVLAAGDATEAAAVAASYPGPLLPGARYETWADHPRRRAAERHLDLLRLAGRWEQVVDADPTDEPAAVAAMRAAIERGHRHRAVSIFERHRRALRDDLAVDPGPDAARLYGIATAGTVASEETVVGRARELATFEALLAGDLADAWLAVVSGPPGIGKTTATRELARLARQRGHVLVAVAADGTNDAYAVLGGIVERLVDGRPEVTARLDDKTRSVLAMLAPMPGEVRPLELPLTRHQVVGSMRRLLEQVTADRGVVIVVDDADRADEPSLDVLAMLGDRALPRVLVVFTHRDGSTGGEALPRALARASRTRPPVVLALGALPDDEAVALARMTAPELDHAALADVVARAEGAPLFVVALARAGGAASGRAGSSSAVAAWLDSLTEGELDWLSRLAILGGRLDLAEVVALGGRDGHELDDLLDRALASSMLVVDDDGYRFRHELVREVLADRLPPHRRAAVHRDAAQRLARLGARPGRLAEHWIAGGRPDEAAASLVAAADEAIRLGGYRAAVDHTERALALVPGHPVALRTRAQAFDALGDLRALAAYDDAIAAADPDARHELRPLQALAQIKMGDPEGALVTIAGARPTTLESQLAQALTMSGAALLGATGPETGTELSALGRRAALSSGDPSAVVVASWAQAAVAHARGELRESLWADLADTSALPRLAVTVFDGQLCITQRLLYGNRPYDDVIRFTDDFAAEARRLGAARGVAFATTLRGEAELLSGRLDDADRDLWEGAQLHHRLAASTGEAFSLQRLAEAAHERGDDESARRLLDDALELARSSDIGFHLLDRIYGTRIRLAHDPDEALAMVAEAEESVRGPFETCPGCRITLEFPAAIAVARAGDLERLERYERSCTFLAQVVMHLPAWDAALEELRGHATRARGDEAAARVHFRVAADAFARVEHPLDARRCERELAGSSG